MDEKRKPLRYLWDALSVFGGIIGLSSLVERWADDLLKWRGFIATLVDTYRTLVTPIFDFLFSWLPFQVPNWIGDYLFLGMVISSSLAKSVLPRWRTYNRDNPMWKHVREELLFPPSNTPAFFKQVAHLLLSACVAWPAFIVHKIGDFLGHRMEKNAGTYGDDEKVKEIVKLIDDENALFIQWISIILIGVIILLSTNVYILSAP